MPDTVEKKNQHLDKKNPEPAEREDDNSPNPRRQEKDNLDADAQVLPGSEEDDADEEIADSGTEEKDRSIAK